MRVTCRVVILVGIAALGMTSRDSLAEQSIKATLLSDSIRLEPHDAKAGRITLDVTNAASNAMEHELVVLRTDLADSALPVSKGRVLERRMTKIGEVEGLAPGQRKRMTVKLGPGRYVLICNKPGHYEAGMHTALVVAP